MSATGGDARRSLGPAGTGTASGESPRPTEAERRPADIAPSANPSGLSLMITNRQRARLRAMGFPDASIRLMTPAEAHRHLRLGEPDR